MRAISRLAPAPVQSSTGVHSCTVLVAKPDLDSRCIRRLDRDLVGSWVVRLLRAVALDRGFAPVPPVGWTAEVLFASGQAVCVGSVWDGSYGRFAPPLTGASPPYPRLCGLLRFSLQAEFFYGHLWTFTDCPLLSVIVHQSWRERPAKPGRFFPVFAKIFLKN